MTPQSNLMVVAPIVESRESELRQLLATMNLEPGVANPENPLVPFGRLRNLHFARFVILEDDTREDLAAYGRPPASATKSLAFLCDFDGPISVFRRDLVACAEGGLRQLFSYCQPAPGDDLLVWLGRNERPASASYVNWIGRTMQQVREEMALYQSLVPLLAMDGQSSDARQVWNNLRQFVRQEQAAGRLTLSPREPR